MTEKFIMAPDNNVVMPRYSLTKSHFSCTASLLCIIIRMMPCIISKN